MGPPPRLSPAPMITQFTGQLAIRAARPGLQDCTSEVRDWVAKSGISDGLLTIFCRHTSASLLIQENAAPAARRDLEDYFARLAPEGAAYTHDDEGPDDMPAHLRSALTNSQLSVPVSGGELALGRWQGIYLFEHRRDPPLRSLALHLIGE